MPKTREERLKEMEQEVRQALHLLYTSAHSDLAWQEELLVRIETTQRRLDRLRAAVR